MGALGTLALVDGAVTLALQVGSVLIPLIKGAIVSIKKDMSPQGIVTYAVVISTDQAELADTVNVSIADLVAINKELTGQGASTLTVPTMATVPVTPPVALDPQPPPVP